MSNEKHDLETGALTQFSNALAHLWGEGRFAFHELRKPPEPDGFCSLDGQPLHVEVGHFYGTQSDAKRILGRKGKYAATDKDRFLSSLVPLDERLLAPLNNLLADKAKKSYCSSRVWLLIRAGSPLWSFDEFKGCQAEIVIPQVHPFEQIWLLHGWYASHGVSRLA